MAKKIYVLDDDIAILNLLKKLLENEGYVVMTKDSTVGATFEIKKFKPDVVILDITIPNQLDGDSLVDMIRLTIMPSPKMIFYSSKPPNELFKLVEETGVDGYVCKTDGPKALIGKIKSVLPA